MEASSPIPMALMDSILASNAGPARYHGAQRGDGQRVSRVRASQPARPVSLSTSPLAHPQKDWWAQQQVQVPETAQPLAPARGQQQVQVPAQVQQQVVGQSASHVEIVSANMFSESSSWLINGVWCNWRHADVANSLPK